MLRHMIVAAALVAAPVLPARAIEGTAGPYLAVREAVMLNAYDAAVPYLERLLALQPDDPFLLENGTLIHLALGQFDRALPLAERLHALDVESQTGRLVLIADRLVKDPQDPALDALLTDAAVGPLVAGLLEAWMDLERGRMSETVELLDALAERPGLQAFGLYHKALALAYAGDFEGAEEILSGDVAGPIQVARRGVIARLQILSQLGRFDDALAVLEEAFGPDASPDVEAIRAALEAEEPIRFDVVTAPRDGMAEAFFDVASTLQGETDDTVTLVYARLAEWLRPGHVPAQLLSAQLLTALGQHDLAAAAYGEIAAGDPFHYLAEMGRADALYLAERKDEALDVLRALSERHGEIATVHIALGDMLRREEMFDEASRSYDRAVDLLGEPQPQHWTLYYTRGISREREDRWEQAEADFRLALELRPEQPHVLNYLGYSLVERREHLDEALDMIERAVAGEPDNGYITDSLGWVLYRLGRYREAVAPMERAAELLPRDPIVNDHLGDVYWAVGRRLEARFQWRRALSFEPEEDDLARIRRKLEVGLDQVLIEEGAEPHHDVSAQSN